MERELIEIGRIVNTHGIKGELKLLPHDERPEDLRALRSLFVDGQEMKILSARVHKGALLVMLEYKGRAAFADADDPGLPEGFVFMDELFGCAVRTEDGEELGTLEEIIDSPANQVYVVRGAGSERLIPAIPEFVVSVDAEAGEIVVRLIPGM